MLHQVSATDDELLEVLHQALATDDGLLEVLHEVMSDVSARLLSDDGNDDGAAGYLWQAAPSPLPSLIMAPLWV